MKQLLLIAVFGAGGSLLRYGLGALVQRAAGVTFPLGTLVVNVIGCFAIGFLNAMFLVKLVAPEWRVAVLVGLLGGFTTFSSYAWETVSLADNNQLGLAFLNIVSTNVVGVAVALLAYRLGQWMFGAA
jgi:CrcB protein